MVREGLKRKGLEEKKEKWMDWDWAGGDGFLLGGRGGKNGCENGILDR